MKEETPHQFSDFIKYDWNPPVERDVQHRIYTTVAYYPQEPRQRILSKIVEYHPVIRFSR